jgi:hypothetical protein
LSFQNYTRYDDPSKRLHNEIWFGWPSVVVKVKLRN